MLGALFLVLTLAGDTPPPSQTSPTFAGGLELVKLTVTARDASGRLVTDLGREDFLVFEDGRPQKVEVFAPAVVAGKGTESWDEALSLDLGLLLDTSESMISELRLSQESALRFLEAIPRARNLLTVFFDHDIRISRYDNEHQQGLIDRILEIKGGGNTALYDAIAVYLSRASFSAGRNVMVLFTDGEDTTSRLSLGETLRLVQSSSVTIYPIAFVGGFPTGSRRAITSMAFLRQLAELTGGQVFSPSSSRDLGAIYDKILEELATQYVLGYVSDNHRQDGKFRKVKVEISGRSLRVRHRTGYYGTDKADH